IDFDVLRKLALECKPVLILSGLTAYPRKLDFKAFQEIADEVGAYHFSDIAHIAGLVVAGLHDNPMDVCDVVTTTTHKTLRGPRGAIILCRLEDRLHDKYHPDSKKNLAQLIDSAVFPGQQGGPHDHMQAAKAVAFKECLEPEFKDYSAKILANAKAIADELLAQGFRLVTGGTDNHLVVADVWEKGITGKEAQGILESVGIFLNKNTVPYDKRSPFDPSGIRLGTPALTTRGMGTSEMKEIGALIAKTLLNREKPDVLDRVKGGVRALCDQFPLYPEFQDGYFKA
ncbi:MAG: serine hydroxymethyltransferase, partial [Candidatus Aenigmatarchaeota archaeon]